ncbi:hypothetical protein OH77DRAFT_1428959 [Trametes cingulata]|nr:hypothetical protein OH77DRAFT_1428959 [Trametes cingulata]
MSHQGDSLPTTAPANTVSVTTHDSDNAREPAENEVNRRLTYHASTSRTPAAYRDRLILAFDGQDLGIWGGDQEVISEPIETYGDHYVSQVVLWVRRPRDSGSESPLGYPLQLRLPRRLEQLREDVPAGWNRLFERIAERYGDHLSRGQWDAITAICYTYRWFAGVALDQNVLDAWEELGNVLESSAVMCLWMGTPAHDGIRNVALWARARIPGAYPIGTRIWGMAEPRTDDAAPSSEESEGVDEEGSDGDI